MNTNVLRSFFSRVSKNIAIFSLGAFLMVSGGTFAALNDGISLPGDGSAGDILTADFWNQLINGIGEVDNRTREIASSTDGNVAIGDDETKPEDEQDALEKLDVRGAIKIGDTESTNTGTIRFHETVVEGVPISDFEGYTGDEWKSLTSGEGGSGGECTTVSSDIDFLTETTLDTGVVSASCDSGTISYAAVEWEDDKGVFASSIALSTNAGGTTAGINALGNACKVHLICCEGGAGSGGANDVLANLNCSDGNVAKWDSAQYKWVCAVDDSSGGGEGTDGKFVDGLDVNDAVYMDGNVGIGTSTPDAKLHINAIGDASLTSTGHGITIGSVTGYNLAMDGNEILARNNGGSANLYLQNENTGTGDTIINRAAGNVGIGTSSPSAKLHIKTLTGTNSEINIQSGNKSKWAMYHDEGTEELRLWNNSNLFTFFKNGNLKVRGAVTVGQYTLPANDGAPGQVLQTDGNGVLTWVNIIPTPLPDQNCFFDGNSTWDGSCDFTRIEQGGFWDGQSFWNGSIVWQ